MPKLNESQLHLVKYIDKYRSIIKEVGDCINDYEAGFGFGHIMKPDGTEPHFSLYIITKEERDWLIFNFYALLRLDLHNYIPDEEAQNVVKAIGQAAPILSTLQSEDGYKKYCDKNIVSHDSKTLMDAFIATEIILKAVIPGRKSEQTKTDKSQPVSGNSESGNIQEASEAIKPNVEAIRFYVFISYSHKDERWLSDLQKHLKPYLRDGSTTAWSDRQITPGSKWLPEIEKALTLTKVAVLLVTPDFLASDFIHEKELGPLLKEAEKGGVRILWIPVRACSYKKTPLKDYQAVIDPDKPLVNFRLNRDKTWVKICEEIEKAVKS